MDECCDTVGLPPGLVVVVLGPPSVGLVGALWGAGLRPVRGQRGGTVWALPERGRGR
jgi:hypothetical protein